MSKQSRLFVVDASVMRSAGTKEGHSASCLRLLNEILTICHRVTITTDIQLEWNKHQSGMAQRWRKAMIAKKKLIVQSNSDRVYFEHQIDNQLPSSNRAERQALMKDAHLLAAAHACDRLLLTADAALQSLCHKYNIDQGIEWLVIQPISTSTERQKLSKRLIDLATSRPNPSLPVKQ